MGNYKDYLKFYKRFSTSNGYYEACDLLAFRNNPWIEHEEYKKILEHAIKKIKGKTGKALIGADFCSGRQMWLSRYFDSYFEKIYSVDIDKNAFKKVSGLTSSSKIKTQMVIADAVSAKLPQEVDFLYSGFNVYLKFIPNFLDNLKIGGVIFLMKPKIGDDLTLRSEVIDYSIVKRIQEIKNITRSLKEHCEGDYLETIYHWVFPARLINQVLAGFSVVSMGGQYVRLTKEQYNKAINRFSNLIHNDVLVISQTVSLWEYEKKKGER